MLVLDSGAVTRLAEQSRRTSDNFMALRGLGSWPPSVPAPVLVECLTGHPGRDAKVNQFLKTCEVIEAVFEPTARRAAYLRTRAGRGSAVDALVVALAEPDGRVLTTDRGDVRALATYAAGVIVERV